MTIYLVVKVIMVNSLVDSYNNLESWESGNIDSINSNLEQSNYTENL